MGIVRNALGLICGLGIACGGGGQSAEDASVPDAPMTDTPMADTPMVDGGLDVPAIDGGPDVFDAGPPVEMEPATDIGDELQEVWVFMQSHLHTTGFHSCANNPTAPEEACYSSEGIRGFLDEALDNDASDMVITDHNNIESWFDPAFAPVARGERYATPLRGTEWSSGDGHMTLLFADEAASSNAEALTNGWVYGPGNRGPLDSEGVYEDIISSVHAAGGVVMINHPELAIHSFPEDSYGADGVEVGIPPNPLDDIGGGAVGLQASAEARRYWQRRLVSGDRLAGTAGSDHHHGGGDIPGLEAPTFGVAVNLLRIDPALPMPASAADAVANPALTIQQRSNAVVDAVRTSHIMVVEDINAARVYIGADTDADGRFHNARAGDCIQPESFDGAEFRVRLKITNPSNAFGSNHYNLEAWDHTDDNRPAWFVQVDYEDGFAESDLYTIDPDDPFAIEFTLDFDPSERRFLRFVLVRDVLGPFNDTDVVVNPIYYGDWAEECAGSAPLY